MLLLVETAGSRCAVALADKAGRLLAARDPDLGRGHAERLMGLVAEVLGEAGAAYADLTRIAVSVGPGSFTGLRVGVAAARGLALALGVPVVGVSTLEALAEPFCDREPVLAAIDAKRGEVYLAAYGPGDASPLRPVAVPLAELPGILESVRPAVLVGSGAPVAAEALGRTELRIENAAARIDLAAFARLARRADPAVPPRPLYLRGADAKPQRTPILKLRAEKAAAEPLP